MSRMTIFWVLMLVWAVFGILAAGGYVGQYGAIGSRLLDFVLFLLLGWQCYGAPVKD